MNNDLISRSALKATIMSKADNMEDLWDTAGVLNAINNAPTVEQRDNFDLGYIQGLEDGKNERPQADNFDVEDFKKFVESRLDMQDLYLPIHFFYLLDEYRDTKAKEANND